ISGCYKAFPTSPAPMPRATKTTTSTRKPGLPSQRRPGPEPQQEDDSAGQEGAGEGELDVEAPVEGPEAVEADGIEPPRQRGALARARDQVERFLSEVRRYPRLTDEEERLLGKAVRDRADPEAARKLVVHNLRLVVAIAYQYRRAWANILDLFQE